MKYLLLLLALTGCSDDKPSVESRLKYLEARVALLTDGPRIKAKCEELTKLKPGRYSDVSGDVHVSYESGIIYCDWFRYSYTEAEVDKMLANTKADLYDKKECNKCTK
jgi:hypothetical protein